MKTVKIVHEALRKACATRPSDAMVGKPTNGTATDWVTRGPLNLSTRHGGLMYSRVNISNHHYETREFLHLRIDWYSRVLL